MNIIFKPEVLPTFWEGLDEKVNIIEKSTFPILFSIGYVHAVLDSETEHLRN